MNFPDPGKLYHGVRCILYELLPVHPKYAYAQLKDLKNATTQTLKILSPKIISLILFIVRSIRLISLNTWLSILLWCAVWKLFIYIEFGSIYIILSLFGVIFSNLGQKKEGDLSAYSVFNKGFTTLLGQSTGQQFDKEIRHNNYDDEEDDDKDNLGAEIRVGEIKANGDGPRRRGKKARRTYEARLERRNAENDRLDTFDEFMD